MIFVIVFSQLLVFCLMNTALECCHFTLGWDMLLRVISNLLDLLERRHLLGRLQGLVIFGLSLGLHELIRQLLLQLRLLFA